MFKSKFKLTFGTDPEVFSTIESGDKNLVISPALLEKFSNLREVRIKNDTRTNEEKIKHPVYIKSRYFNWMMDGVAWEATVSPAKVPQELFDKMVVSLMSLQEVLNSLEFNDKKLNLFQKPVVDIEPDMYLPYLNEERILQGFIFGCDPDEDAIIPNYKCETIDVAKHLYRYGGGHFHIGSEDPKIVETMQEIYMPFLRLLAIFVGNVSIAFSKFPEEEKKRAKTYGKPGRFRFQKWGIEYRSPSNSWISDSGIIELMFEGAEKAVYFLQKPDEGIPVINKYLTPTINAISEGDSKTSMEILQEILI
ncbi:MAG: hypothetical protein BV456_01725 [Thermoplasmata archaeon M8B2D]|nr:MAG: hypothetical protein BV456_01725 [Thermoplasmata archaeon M8B2D]